MGEQLQARDMELRITIQRELLMQRNKMTVWQDSCLVNDLMDHTSVLLRTPPWPTDGMVWEPGLHTFLYVLTLLSPSSCVWFLLVTHWLSHVRLIWGISSEHFGSGYSHT